MESTIKRIHRRSKGTERSFRDGPKPQLELTGDKISEPAPLDAYWRNEADAHIARTEGAGWELRVEWR